MQPELPAQTDESKLEERLAELNMDMQILVSEERQACASLDIARFRHRNEQVQFSLNGQLGRVTAVTALLLYLSLFLQGVLPLKLLLAALLAVCIACHILAVRSRKLLAASEITFKNGSLDRENRMQEIDWESIRIQSILRCLQKELAQKQLEEEANRKPAAAQQNGCTTAASEEQPGLQP